MEAPLTDNPADVVMGGASAPLISRPSRGAGRAWVAGVVLRRPRVTPRRAGTPLDLTGGRKACVNRWAGDGPVGGRAAGGAGAINRLRGHDREALGAARKGGPGGRRGGIAAWFTRERGLVQGHPQPVRHAIKAAKHLPFCYPLSPPRQAPAISLHLPVT